MYGDPSSIIEHLQDLKKPDEGRELVARKIGTAADLGDIKANTKVIRSLFVLCMTDDRKSANETHTCGKFTMVERFAVVYAVDNTQAKRADFTMNKELIEFRKIIRARFRLFKPEGNDKELKYQRGKMMAYNDTTLWWQDEFLTEYKD